MKSLIRWFSCFLLIISSSAFADANNVVARQITVLPFKHLSISGVINVEIYGSKKQSVTVIGDSYSVSQADVRVNKGYLHLNMNKDYKPRYGSNILIKVYTPVLGELAYDGVGTVTGRNLSSGPTRLIAAGSGSINLTGRGVNNLQQIYATGANNICINGIYSRNLVIQHSGSGNMVLTGIVITSRIDYSGNGGLDIRWIDSSYLRVNGGGKGVIKLAGVVGLLDVKLSQNAYLDARYLRVQRGFINTVGNSAAHVSTNKMLAAVSNDHSNIYYYHDANYVGGYMHPSGSVLRMIGARY